MKANDPTKSINDLELQIGPFPEWRFKNVNILSLKNLQRSILMIIDFHGKLQGVYYE